MGIKVDTLTVKGGRSSLVEQYIVDFYGATFDDEIDHIGNIVILESETYREMALISLPFLKNGWIIMFCNQDAYGTYGHEILYQTTEDVEDGVLKVQRDWDTEEWLYFRGRWERIWFTGATRRKRILTRLLRWVLRRMK
jgi:hypothetical protein